MQCYTALLAALLTGVTLWAQVSVPEEADTQQAQRDHWFYEQRRYPLGHIPTAARVSAIEQLRRQAKPRALPTALGNWTLIGPQPTAKGSGYTTAGRVNTIAIDPRDNNVVYIGAAEGGIWKTNDGGGTWIPLTDDQPSLANGALILDPNHPDIIYAGTGEENFTQDSYYGAGILKSADGGATWTNLPGPFLRARIGSLAISPDSKTLLCTTEQGVWRSADGAVSWKQVMGSGSTGITAGTSVAFHPSDSSLAYAAVGWLYGDTRNGVYRSTDAGLTWQPALGSGAAALPNTNIGRITLAIDPTAASTLYAAIQDAGQDNFGRLLGVWKSTDGANTWARLDSFPPEFCHSQCWYDMALAVNPKNPSMLFAGGVELVRSLDGGATWEELPFAGPNGVSVHVDQHALCFTPDGSALYVGNDGGMYNTTGLTASRVSFNQLNDTLAVTQFYPGISVDPTNIDTAIGGTQDNGTQLFHGVTSWSPLSCGDGGYTAIDPASSKTFFAVCHDIQIERGASSGPFYPVVYGIDPTDRSEFIAPLELDAANPSVLYFGTYRIWETTDAAGLWRAISPDLTADSSDVITTIAVAPSDSQVVYAGTEHGFVQTTPTAGHPVWSLRSNGLPQRSITRIVVDPVDPSTAYAAFSGFSMGPDTQGHIFQTTDGGLLWTDISGTLPNLPVNDLVVDPDLPGTLYAGTDAGVLLTNDGGANWTPLGTGLPLVVVESLVLQRQARILRAATHGRSVWEFSVPLPGPSQQPAITSLTPAQANVGSGSQTVKLAGANFTASTVVRWNGAVLPTTVLDASDLMVQVPAGDIAVLGRAALQAFSPAPAAGASNPVYFVVGPAPVSGFQAFVNAANPVGGNTLAPGAIGSLYGANFASRTVLADAAPPLPLTLGGVTLTLDKIPIPLYFVSPNQINFQVPYFGISRLTALTLVVTQGSLSTSFPVNVASYAPALFTANAQGTGQASAFIAGASTVPAPAGMFPGSRPAHAGEYVSFYCTGLGAVTNTPLEGYPARDNPLSMTLATPAVSIGGLPASVSFSGLAPGFVGLYQINAQVPAGLPAGPAVPVLLTLGGTTSNTATIAVE